MLIWNFFRTLTSSHSLCKFSRSISCIQFETTLKIIKSWRVTQYKILKKSIMTMLFLWSATDFDAVNLLRLVDHVIKSIRWWKFVAQIISHYEKSHQTFWCSRVFVAAISLNSANFFWFTQSINAERITTSGNDELKSWTLSSQPNSQTSFYFTETWTIVSALLAIAMRERRAERTKYWGKVHKNQWILLLRKKNGKRMREFYFTRKSTKNCVFVALPIVWKSFSFIFMVKRYLHCINEPRVKC